MPHLLPDFLRQLEDAEAAYTEANTVYKAARARVGQNGDTDEDAEELELVEEVSETEVQALKKKQSAAQRKRRAEKTFLAELNAAIIALSSECKRDLVLDILNEDLTKRLDARIATQRQTMIARFQTWSGKYAFSLDQLKFEHQSADLRLSDQLRELGYE